MKKNSFYTVLAVASLFGMTACTPAVDDPAPVVSTSTSAEASPSASAEPTAEVATEAPVEEVTTEPAPSPEPTEAPVEEIIVGSAMEALKSLAVQPAYTGGGYDRDAFGAAWEDVDGNGCDTRNDILRRDIPNASVGSDCTVQFGSFPDPYTGTVIEFDRSAGGGGGIDIDHVVALSAAWATGAADWDATKRLQFANDPLNLLASDSGENRGKGDKDASAYLPPNQAFHCEYVARQIAVKAKYTAWVTPAEKSAMETVLATCPDEPLPSDGTITDVSETITEPAPVVEEMPTTHQEVLPNPTGGIEPNYGSCEAVKMVGAGPYTQGVDPEYDFYRDGDNDGVVCE